MQMIDFKSGEDMFIAHLTGRTVQPSGMMVSVVPVMYRRTRMKTKRSDIYFNKKSKRNWRHEQRHYFMVVGDTILVSPMVYNELTKIPNTVN